MKRMPSTIRILAATIMLATGACGSGADSTDDGGADGRDSAASDGDAALAGPQGALSKELHVNNFGWRPNDRKVALLLGHASVAVQLLSVADNSVAWSGNASATLQTDEDSTDQVATVDFSAFTTAGDYYLYVPSLDARSYTFRIAQDVYAIVGAAAMKSFYYQRCNHDKALPYATDALSGFPGRGGQWVDGICHATDSAAPAGPGSVDNGPLDLHGGWHDAGDYQKTLWGRGVPDMLFAYELNPSVWTDGQLNIPESGNGIPDILDELSWELDFYVRMQRPDGHFMSSTKGKGDTTTSPPSKSDQGRVYFDCTAPSGDGWSGGGVTIAQATGNAVLSLAHAAIVFRSIGKTSIGDGYATAATNGWTWLSSQTLTAGDKQLKAAAASAIFRMDPTNATAKAFADAFPWDTLDGALPYSATPAENVMSFGAYHYLSNTSGTAAVAAKAKTGVAALVDRAFQQAGAYGGMFGSPSNGWNWGWGSNRAQAQYGSTLMMAAHFDALGTHSAADVAFQAQKYLHYLLGLNPLNMLYMTTMAAYGGEHSSFQIFHGWFSTTGNDGDHGNVAYNGKPAWVDEPMYPYYKDDNQTSTYGPAPGIMPGGPNPSYSGKYVIPNLDKPAYAYRDFSVGCAWNAATSTCDGASWEITEPMAAYQGPLVLLLSFVMSGG